jgi:hypothetical protein
VSGPTSAGDKTTETTRYLCAAAHRDLRFRKWVIQNIVDEKYKAIGESHGVDVPTIVKHCLAARRRDTIQGFLLTILFILLIVLGVWTYCSMCVGQMFGC